MHPGSVHVRLWLIGTPALPNHDEKVAFATYLQDAVDCARSEAKFRGALREAGLLSGWLTSPRARFRHVKDTKTGLTGRAVSVKSRFCVQARSWTLYDAIQSVNRSTTDVSSRTRAIKMALPVTILVDPSSPVPIACSVSKSKSVPPS